LVVVDKMGAFTADRWGGVWVWFIVFFHFDIGKERSVS
jgi:hypothetical protein